MEKKVSYTLSEATSKMEAFCAYQERCHKEVIERLRNMNMIPMSIDHILAHLIKHNYLNEERFARSFARGKFSIKKWGKKRIVNELKLRGISKYNIRAALEEIPETEYYQTFNDLAQKRFDALTDTDRLRKKKKLVDYLLYRGWEPAMVYEKAYELIP